MRRSIGFLNVTFALLLVAGALVPAVVAASGHNSGGHNAPLVASRRAAPIRSAAHKPMSSVIVRKAPGSNNAAEEYVVSLGGRVTSTLPMLNGFIADVPVDAIPKLRARPDVNSVTPNASVRSSWSNDQSWSPNSTDRSSSYSSRTAKNVYLDTIRAKSVWSLGRDGTKGDNVRVVVIDSGISDHQDFGSSSWSSSSRVEVKASCLASDTGTRDYNGHGTVVAGLISGNGSASSGKFSGVAPDSDIISLRAGDSQGRATEGDVLNAMQWVYDHRAAYNIRVVNLSMNSTTAQSYNQSAIDAACEILWFNGVVVVVSAGNTGPNGDTIRSGPANDPFVITVGSSDDKQTTAASDDTVTAFSAYGTTTDGFSKPDIYAPGRNIYSTLSKDSPWATLYPERLDSTRKYFRLSGTSMSAPIVAGAAALLLEDEPSLTPDQVKYRLLTQSATITDPSGAEQPYLDVYKAVTGSTSQSANTGTNVSQLLTTGDQPVLADSVMWRSVMWRSVMWNSVMWRSVMWNSVMWRSTDAFRVQSVMWN